MSLNPRVDEYVYPPITAWILEADYAGCNSPNGVLVKLIEG